MCHSVGKCYGFSIVHEIYQIGLMVGQGSRQAGSILDLWRNWSSRLEN